MNPNVTHFYESIHLSLKIVCASNDSFNLFDKKNPDQQNHFTLFALFCGSRRQIVVAFSEKIIIFWRISRRSFPLQPPVLTFYEMIKSRIH